MKKTKTDQLTSFLDLPQVAIEILRFLNTALKTVESKKKKTLCIGLKTLGNELKLPKKIILSNLKELSNFFKITCIDDNLIIQDKMGLEPTGNIECILYFPNSSTQ